MGKPIRVHGLLAGERKDGSLSANDVLKKGSQPSSTSLSSQADLNGGLTMFGPVDVVGQAL